MCVFEMSDVQTMTTNIQKKVLSFNYLQKKNNTKKKYKIYDLDQAVDSIANLSLHPHAYILLRFC